MALKGACGVNPPPPQKKVWWQCPSVRPSIHPPARLPCIGHSAIFKMSRPTGSPYFENKYWIFMKIWMLDRFCLKLPRHHYRVIYFEMNIYRRKLCMRVCQRLRDYLINPERPLLKFGKLLKFCKIPMFDTKKTKSGCTIHQQWTEVGLIGLF